MSNSKSKQGSHEHRQFLSRVAYPHPFAELAVTLCEDATRYIDMMSPNLDHDVFDSSALVEVAGRLARRSRQSRVRILISDSRPLVARGHRLLELARRLPSSVTIKKLKEHPDWSGSTVLLRDRNGVLFKPAGGGHDGFFEADSRASAQRHIELFEELWRLGESDVELRCMQL